MNIDFSPEWTTYLIAILSFIALVFMFFASVASGSEVAFFTLSSKDINYFKIRTDRSSNYIVQLIEKPFALKNTLRSTKILSSIFIIAATSYIAHIVLIDYVSSIATIMLIVIVFNLIIQLLIIESIPKMYSRQNKIRMLIFAVPFVNVFFFLLKGFVSKNRHDDILNKTSSSYDLNPDEFEEAVRSKLGHEPSKDELDMFRGIMTFGQITVKQVMQPRMNISSIREEWDLEQVRTKILKSRFSRMPVYKHTIDHITGILFSKDILELDQNNDTDWHALIRPALYVHETKLIEDLFQEFQQKRVHAAIVVDEYGGTSGLITLENIMEQIVGEIRDEYEEEALNYKKVDNNQYIFEGSTHINAMCRILGEDYDTFDSYKRRSTSINGLVLEVTRKFPEKNEVVTIGDYEFMILETVNQKIERVKVSKIS